MSDLTEHIHCAECFCQIETKTVNEEGVVEGAVVRAGVQFVPRPGPQGMNIVPRQVPICDGCFEKINTPPDPASKLVVPPGVRKLGLVQ